MKKNILLIALTLCVVFASYAQQYQTERIVEKDKLVTIIIEYTASLDEAHFIYTCPAALFDQSEAAEAIKERAILFTKERGYFFYTYYKPDVTKFDNTRNVATHTSFIKFLN